MAATQTARQTMGKKKTGQQEGRGEEPKTTTKVAIALLRKARMVSIHKNIDLYDYIDGILRPTVEQDYQRMIQDEAR